MRNSRTDNLTERLRDIAHAMNDEMYPHKAFTLFKAAERIEALEAALRWLVGDGVIEVWEHNNDVEVWSESDWEWVLAPNDIARTLVEFSKNGTP